MRFLLPSTIESFKFIVHPKIIFPKDFSYSLLFILCHKYSLDAEDTQRKLLVDSDI